jgi:glucosylceramidase
MPDIRLGPLPEAVSAPVVVTADENERFQTMEGFGASFTESAATVVQHGLALETRTDLLRRLFDPATGIGLSLLRQPMGASDFALDSYTYDDVPSGGRDPSLARFSVQRDDVAVVPLLLDALGWNPELRIMGTPWSPPAWMKSSRSLIGGSLDPESYETYARYFVRFVQEYGRRGIPIFAVTAQNEPHFEPTTYPGMRMTPTEEAAFVGRHLGPAFAAAGLSTRILAFDGNWDGVAHAVEVLDDPAAGPLLAGAAFHCYAGDPSRQEEVHDRHPGKAIYLTECSGGGWSPDFGANLCWAVHTLVIEAVRHWASTIVLWNIALDERSGPQNGGCPDCRGVVTVDTRNRSVQYNVEFYVLGHVSKFVRPGAVRIGSTTVGTGGVETAAFRNPDGSRALVALNSASEPRTFAVAAAVAVAGAVRSVDQCFVYTLPAGAVATFRW